MDLRARLARGVALPAPSDLLSGDDGDLGGSPIPAAVLVAVVARAEPGLLLTQRTAALRTHAGQIAFPGGRMDPGEDAVAAALREAHEEVGLAPALVDVIGALDPYRTATDFVVTPVLALVPPELELKAQDAEVADIFEVPLAFVIDPGNHVLREMEWQGRTRRYREIPWRDRRIWGATAAMIVNLSRRLEYARVAAL
jgi:8-oxo-dGTP pyrophosphatase MutT (NUDIX family)